MGETADQFCESFRKEVRSKNYGPLSKLRKVNWTFLGFMKIRPLVFLPGLLPWRTIQGILLETLPGTSFQAYIETFDVE